MEKEPGAVDISEELSVIRANRYGEQVRGAVHGSIEKLDAETKIAVNTAMGSKESAKALKEEMERMVEIGKTIIEEGVDAGVHLSGILEHLNVLTKNYGVEDENNDPIKDENNDPIGGNVQFVVQT